MKQEIESLLEQAVARLRGRGELSGAAAEAAGGATVQRTRDARHGDFASNLALALAKPAAANPRDLAAKLVDALPASDAVQKVSVAGPGFINFHIKRDAWLRVIDAIDSAGESYGNSDRGAGRRALVEFVSANPTGPLHVGHGRGAAYGDAVARILSAAGFDARREYYINDGGRQMDILALSVWLRYLQGGDGGLGESVARHFPVNAYQGGYVRDLAAAAREQHGDAFMPGGANDAGDVGDATTATTDTTVDNLFAALPDDAEARIDALIARCKSALGDGYRRLFTHACDALVGQIRDDLLQFGVAFDTWFSERALLDGGDIERAVAALDARGHIYEQDGATWFRASAFGDEKDRAVRRADGSHTYFASDIAYHFNKAGRGFDLLLNVFGADHHGYAGRVLAAFEAFGFDRERLQTRLVQFATLWRGNEKVQMSTRGGQFVTLRALCEEVGVDAARFFYVSRKNDQHMDFDLALARAQSADNPVYYIQYAHARICSVFRREMESGAADAEAPEALTEPGEFELLQTLSRFPEVVEAAAAAFEPHLVAYYLRDLARDFHAYYNAHPFLSAPPGVRRARLQLIGAVRQVIANGLTLLGVSAPEKM